MNSPRRTLPSLTPLCSMTGIGEQMNHTRPCFAYFVACLANSSGVNLPAFT